MWFSLKSKTTRSRLEDKLNALSKLAVSQEQIDKMKRTVMSSRTEQKIVEDFAFSPLIKRIIEIAQQLTPREYFRILLREKLVMLFRVEHARPLNLIDSIRFRKTLAAGLAFVFVLTIVFNFGFGIEKVEASYTTMLEEAIGEVILIRDDKEIQATTGLLLVGDDTLRTGANSKAAIRFLDQSITRLDENTEVKISKLFINPANKTQTIVELVLHRGRVWTRVINLVDNFSRFQVKANNTVAIAKKKAAFDVAITKKNKAKVSAVQNRVDIMVTKDKKISETTLVKGFTAEVASTGLMTNATLQEEKPNEGKHQWIAQNLAQDETYIQTLREEIKQQRQDNVKILPGNPLYAVKELSQNTKIALAGDQFERQKKIAATVKAKLVEAEVLLEKGNVDASRALLEEFHGSILSIAQWLKDREAGQPTAILELRGQIGEMLSAYEKQVAVILPTDPIYPIKEALAQAHVSIAPNEAGKAEARLAIASEKLLEAHDFIEKGNQHGAVQQVEKYKNVVSDVISQVKKLPSDQQERAVTAILDTKLQDIKVLEAIVVTTHTVPPATSSPILGDAAIPPKEETPPIPKEEIDTVSQNESKDEPHTEFSGVPAIVKDENFTTLGKTVADAKAETFTKLSEAVLEVQKTKPHTEVLQKLHDLKEIDVSGKPLLDLKATREKVMTKTSGTVTSVPPNPLPTVDSETQVLPQVQP